MKRKWNRWAQVGAAKDQILKCNLWYQFKKRYDLFLLAFAIYITASRLLFPNRK